MGSAEPNFFRFFKKFVQFFKTLTGWPHLEQWVDPEDVVPGGGEEQNLPGGRKIS